MLWVPLLFLGEGICRCFYFFLRLWLYMFYSWIWLTSDILYCVLNITIKLE
jgi:hypothetical protein